jgi:hypothetical protein
MVETSPKLLKAKMGQRHPKNNAAFFNSQYGFSSNSLKWQI